MEPGLLSGAASTVLEARPGSASDLGRVLGPVSCVGDFSVFRHCLGWVRLIVSTGLRWLLVLVWDVMSVLSSALVPGLRMHCTGRGVEPGPGGSHPWPGGGLRCSRSPTLKHGVGVGLPGQRCADVRAILGNPGCWGGGCKLTREGFGGRGRAGPQRMPVRGRPSPSRHDWLVCALTGSGGPWSSSVGHFQTTGYPLYVAKGHLLMWDLR